MADEFLSSQTFKFNNLGSWSEIKKDFVFKWYPFDSALFSFICRAFNFHALDKTLYTEKRLFMLPILPPNALNSLFCFP